MKSILLSSVCRLYRTLGVTALEELQAWAMDSSPVIDQRGELLGTVSKNKMNRKVGGFGHDPKTEPLEAHIEQNSPIASKTRRLRK
jgi:hypothetical protein